MNFSGGGVQMHEVTLRDQSRQWVTGSDNDSGNDPLTHTKTALDTEHG